MKTGRNILLAVSCLSFCGLGACGGNVAHYYKDFESLCEDSGGEYKGNGICKCDVDCSEGVICVKGVCANKGECKGDGYVCKISDNQSIIYQCVNESLKEIRTCDVKECKQKVDDKCAVCESGSHMCKKSDTTDENVHYMCIYGEWVESNTCINDASCNKKGRCGVCKDGTKKCDAGEIKECKDGGWIARETCISGVCLNNSICSNCAIGFVECQPGVNGENAKLVRCTDGKFVPFDECASSECDSEGTGCKDVVTCTQSYKKCEVDGIVECITGQAKTIQACGEKLRCKDDQTCENCSAEYSECLDGKYIRCINDELVEDKENSNRCETECSGNEKKCMNNRSWAECTGENWSESFPCADNQICEDGTCRECNGDECPPECKDGKCEEPPGENCTSGVVSCEGNFVINCDENGKWVKKECPLGQHCRVDELKCVDNCTDGGCPEGERCDAETNECVKNSGDECDKDKIVKRCENDGDNKVGTIFTSCNGTQETREECVDGNSCNAGLTDCGVCQNGDKKCEEQAVKECTDGNWITKECGEGKKCEDGICKKSDESACHQGNFRCDNNNLQQCLNGNWITKDKCIEKICDIYNGCMEDGTACRFDGDIYCGTWYIATCKDGSVKVIESKPGIDSGVQKSINCKLDTERYVKISFVCNPSSVSSLSMVCEKMDKKSDAGNMTYCSEYFSVEDKSNVVLTFNKQKLKCTN